MMEDSQLTPWMVSSISTLLVSILTFCYCFALCITPACPFTLLGLVNAFQYSVLLFLEWFTFLHSYTPLGMKLTQPVAPFLISYNLFSHRIVLTQVQHLEFDLVSWFKTPLRRNIMEWAASPYRFNQCLFTNKKWIWEDISEKVRVYKINSNR